mmetsp:Transcript_63903/g.101712  ORF Transcript_63903/g.101712 Transcript_63903/m.101712 type:complete len:168 (+) Transcript_63903:134-637(+)|eukprot:CAMPEP_0197026054 /NCGR_PEP_ID=MMETSP1384-20130603/6236_1 /TAXON_ID=29189 /ORGANISM="Ammonia sp." /LENGTH=167 /DNA_ID=CAMNT_0042454659 /DNA_START=55 /DNA_END=558 /DNA_ORIENTATION=-
MAALGKQEEEDTTEIETFIREYNLQTVASGLFREGVQIEDICAKTEDELDAFAVKLSADTEEQQRFKQAVHDKKARADDDEEQKGDKVFVKTLMGKTLSIELTQGMSIKNLKERIEEKEGIPQKQQKLVFAGRTLDADSKTMEQCNIENGSELHLILKSKNDGCCIL